LLLVLWLGEDSRHRQATAPQANGPEVVFEDAERMASIKIEESQLPAVKKPKESAKRHGIALILDDVGYDLPALRRALAFSFPIAISVLPNAPHAASAAKLAHAAGQTVMLHMPMEPDNPKYQKSMDSSFIRVGMQRQKVRSLMFSALISVPYAEGVNNHMGSRLTTLEEPMRWVMETCRERHLFFVDSRTTRGSVAARLAKQAGLRWGERRVFLDDSVEPEKLKRSWLAAKRLMAKDGFVIVIAHPHRQTLDFLEHALSARDRAAMTSLQQTLFPATPSVSGELKPGRV